MLDNLIVNSTYSGWLVFNVSSAMESWMADPSTNFGLYLQVLTTSGKLTRIFHSTRDKPDMRDTYMCIYKCVSSTGV